MTALSPSSKADIVFLCEPAGAGAAAIVVDVSEHRTNLTNNTTYADEASSARTAGAAPRSIALVVDMTTSSSGTMIHHGTSATAYGYRVRQVGSAIIVSENNIDLLGLTILGLAAGARKILIHWGERASGSDVLTELCAYNFTTGEWAFASVVHASFAPTGTDTLTVGAVTGGVAAYSLGMAAFYTVAIGRRFHATAEASIDHVVEPTPPSMPGQRRTPLLTATAADLEIAEDGVYAGPAMLWAGAATREADSRLVSPLVNCVVASPYTEVQNYTDRYHRWAPDAATWRLSARWLWHTWPGPKVNAARCRIHVAVTGGGGVATIGFRIYSIANLPLGQVNPPPIVAYHTVTQTIAASTGASGVWLDLGQVRISRDGGGMTCIALAFEWGADVHTTNVVVRAVTVEPLSADLSGGGSGDIDDKEGG